MKAQLTVSGRTIEVELSTEQLQQLGVEEKRVKKWEDLENIEGWYVSTSSNICKLDLKTKTFNKLKNVFATENQARSALAMAQLSQLMYRDWETLGNRYCIVTGKQIGRAHV